MRGLRSCFSRSAIPHARLPVSFRYPPRASPASCQERRLGTSQPWLHVIKISLQNVEIFFSSIAYNCMRVFAGGARVDFTSTATPKLLLTEFLKLLRTSPWRVACGLVLSSVSRCSRETLMRYSPLFVFYLSQCCCQNHNFFKVAWPQKAFEKDRVQNEL